MSPTAALLLIACFALSCGTREETAHKNRIVQLLDHRQRGLEENNPQMYSSTISRNYNDGIDTYATLKTKAEQFLAQYSQIRIQIENRTIYIDKNRATVVDQYRFTGFLPSGKKLDLRRHVVLRLQYEEAHGWKIVNGINDFSFSS